MTVKDDKDQDIKIAVLEEKIKELTKDLKSNFDQHRLDFYPLKNKMYWFMGVFAGLNIAMAIYNFLMKVK